MSAFADFLQRLLRDGSAVLHGPPEVRPSDQRPVVDLLSAAYADHCLDLAGPPPHFDAETAMAAAWCVWSACWFLLHHGDEPAVVEKALTLPPPANAAQHLSADVTLRFLPQVHRRARAHAVADPLTGFLARLLREWPLSGVLSDVADAPLPPPDFDGHTGLLMLYAERLAANVKPAWTPAGPGLAYVELAFADRGLSVPAAAPVAKLSAVE